MSMEQEATINKKRTNLKKINRKKNRGGLWSVAWFLVGGKIQRCLLCCNQEFISSAVMYFTYLLNTVVY